MADEEVAPTQDPEKKKKGKLFGDPMIELE